jgi:hypothetical protein
MSSDADRSSRLYAQTPSALRPGTRLGEFELLGVLGVGGFGIVYLALDHDLEREVAIKEYLPASLAGRTETQHVSLRSQADAETFALGLKSFVNEARLLARFDHPSLLKVHRFWEANGTAYMAMPVLRGRTLKEVGEAMTTPPDEAALRALMEPLLGAIERLHAEGVYHRDIAPDNIVIEPDGRPVLLDFGAARRVISDRSQTLTAILKPAYAPIEQYAEAGSVKQGPWTDFYALGATLHYLLLKRPPPPATTRALQDEATPLASLDLPGCSRDFLRIVDWMLAPRPAERPQSVGELRDALAGRMPPPGRAMPGPTPAPAPAWAPTVRLPPSAPAAAAGGPWPTAAGFEPPARAAPGGPKPGAGAAAMPPLHAPPVSAALAPPAAGASKWLPAALGLAALGAAAAWLWPPTTAPSTAVPATTAASAPPELVSAPPQRASAPEAAVATGVVAPAGAPAPASMAAPLPTMTAPVPAAAPKPSGEVARKPPAPRPLPAAPAATRAATAGPMAGPAEPDVRAAQASVRQPLLPAGAQAVPAAGTAPTPAPASAAAARAGPPTAAGPKARCSGRNPIMHFVCMERECLRTEFTGPGHPDCLEWRKEARPRE